MKILDIKRVDDKKMDIHKKKKPEVRTKNTGKPVDKRMAFHTRDGMKNTVRTGIESHQPCGWWGGNQRSTYGITGSCKWYKENDKKCERNRIHSKKN